MANAMLWTFISVSNKMKTKNFQSNANTFTMKSILTKTYLFLVFILHSFTLYPQNGTADSLENAIDSLQKVLQTQKEDTNKVNTLIKLKIGLISSQYVNDNAEVMNSDN